MSCYTWRTSLFPGLDTEEALLFSVGIHVLLVVRLRSRLPFEWVGPCLGDRHTKVWFPLSERSHVLLARSHWGVWFPFGDWSHVLVIGTQRCLIPLFWEEPYLNGAHTEEYDFLLVTGAMSWWRSHWGVEWGRASVALQQGWRARWALSWSQGGIVTGLHFLSHRKKSNNVY